MRGNKRDTDEAAAESLYSIFIFSLVIMGLSSYLISKHEGGRAIIIVHLVLVVILAPLALSCYSDGLEVSGGVLFVMTIIWFVALIVLVSDKKLRRVIHDEGQQYFASNNTNNIPKRAVSEAVSEIG